jgi:hypothetical protein
LEVDQRVRQATGRTAVDDDAVTGDEIRPFRRETQHRLGGLPGCSEPFERILVEPTASDSISIRRVVCSKSFRRNSVPVAPAETPFDRTPYAP